MRKWMRNAWLSVFFWQFGLSLVYASPHDLWLLPPDRVQTGESFQIRTSSGMEFPKSENLSDPANYERRFARDPEGRKFELSEFSHEPEFGLLSVAAAQAGIYAVGVETRPKTIELDATDFNHYLVADGLPHIYELRHRNGWLNLPAVEQYSKSPKVLVQVGGASVGDPTVALGLTLEIVPLRNPFELRIGEALPVKVTFRDKLLADARLGWDLEGDGIEVGGTARTDKDGAALIPISKFGLMTVRLTHMTRPAGMAHEWESFWTTLTFRLEEQPGTHR